MDPAGGVTVRRLRRGDVDVMARLFGDLSARGRYLRFLSVTPRFTGRMLGLLADADGTDRVVLVAFRDERPIGEARFIRSSAEPDTADLAVTVIDEEQGRGIARMLAGELAAEADRCGVRRFRFDLSPENRRALDLLRQSGAHTQVVEGLVTGYVDVTSIGLAGIGTALGPGGPQSRTAA